MYLDTFFVSQKQLRFSHCYQQNLENLEYSWQSLLSLPEEISDILVTKSYCAMYKQIANKLNPNSEHDNAVYRYPPPQDLKLHNFIAINHTGSECINKTPTPQ